MPTVKEAVVGYLADAEARCLADSSIEKLSHVFEKQLLGFANANGSGFCGILVPAI
jgi:hypothetical protein